MIEVTLTGFPPEELNGYVHVRVRDTANHQEFIMHHSRITSWKLFTSDTLVGYLYRRDLQG
jgi:uncharacterized protein